MHERCHDGVSRSFAVRAQAGNAACCVCATACGASPPKPGGGRPWLGRRLESPPYQMSNSQRMTRLARATSLGIPALVVLFVWAPLVSHYHVCAPRITEDVVRQAREAPPDSVLRALNQLRILKLGPRDRNEVVRIAEELRRGSFDPRDFENVPPVWQPFFIVPRILLDAHDATRRDEFFLTARDIIVEWGRYERRALLPRGHLWNDHAIAARIGVLTDFWRLYRHHPSYQPAVAKALLEQVDRSAKLLAKEGLFTFNTNHGVMQNLGLLHVSVAFPMLPDAQHYRELGLARLRDQIPFYIDPEGVVLEHSPEYQAWGLQSMAMACRYLTLLGVAIPEDWRRKHERAERVLAALRRPDGTLPTFGDTDGGSDDGGPLACVFDAQGRCETLRHRASWVPKQSLSLYAVAGHAVWWDGLADWPKEKDLRQTVIQWSSFPGHAHKHADEMSVLMWAGGQLWWTNVGYWPYGIAGRSETESWYGGNAPHLSKESADSPRSTSLLSWGWSDRLGVVDLERSGPGEYVARRQVVHIRPDVWLIVDHVSGNGAFKTTTTWTTSADVRLEQGRIPGSYVLAARRPPVRLRTFVYGSPTPTIEGVEGSLSPFAGWHVMNGSPRPAPAIVIEQPARDSWSIVVWSLEDSQVDSTRFLTDPQVLSWNDPDDWSVELGGKSEVREVGRERRRITVRDARHGVIETLELTPAPDMTDEVAQIRSSFAKAQRAYPRFYDLLSRRTKVTLLLLVVFLGQELFFSVIKRKRNDYYGRLRVLSVVGWISAGCWLMLWFLKGWPY